MVHLLPVHRTTVVQVMIAVAQIVAAAIAEEEMAAAAIKTSMLRRWEQINGHSPNSGGALLTVSCRIATYRLMILNS